MSETERMNAYIWATKTHPHAVPLMDLQKGERFVWPPLVNYIGKNHIKTYRGSGWYTNGSGKCFRAGVKTAVIRVEDKQ